MFGVTQEHIMVLSKFEGSLGLLRSSDSHAVVPERYKDEGKICRGLEPRAAVVGEGMGNPGTDFLLAGLDVSDGGGSNDSSSFKRLMAPKFMRGYKSCAQLWSPHPTSHSALHPRESNIFMPVPHANEITRHWENKAVSYCYYFFPRGSMHSL